jgi:uncharacterized protein YukE
MAAGGMLKYIRPMVFQVLGTMTQQISFLEEATGQIRSMVPGLGESWVGEDSEAFSREVTGQFLPEVATVIAAVGALVVAITRAAEVIEQADREAVRMAEELQQELGRVF